MHVFLHILYIYEHTYKYNILRKIFTVIASLEKNKQAFQDRYLNSYLCKSQFWMNIFNKWLFKIPASRLSSYYATS